MSDNWFNCDLSDLTEPPLRYCRQPENTKYDQPEHRRVTIAILDTGLVTLHPYIMQILDRVRNYKSWVAHLADKGDACGHGTFLTSLIMKIAPAADIYVVRIFESTTGGTQNQ